MSGPTEVGSFLFVHLMRSWRPFRLCRRMLVQSGLDICLPDTVALFDVMLRGLVDVEATKLKPVFKAEIPS